MPAQPLVSILVVTYNQRDLIVETLNSILADPDPCFEIVVGDDASTDGTPALLAELAAQHAGKLVVVQATQNRGITRNCNATLAAARGEFIALCGGDDLWVAGRIAKQRAALLANPTAGLCHGNSEWFAHETGLPIRLQHAPGAPLAQMTSWHRLLRENYIASPSVMVRKTAIPAHGFDPAIPMASDWLFCIECGHGGIVYLPEPLVRYRIHARSVSAMRAGSMAADSLHSLTLAEQRYGHEAGVQQAIRIGRANIYRQIAKNKLVEGAPLQSLKAAIHALRLNPWAWRTSCVLGLAGVCVCANTVGARKITQALGRRLNKR
jgi:glycosyltransferase involved in cell wall biosynthesis